MDSAGTSGRVVFYGCPSSPEFEVEFIDVEMEELSGSVDLNKYDGQLFS